MRSRQLRLLELYGEQRTSIDDGKPTLARGRDEQWCEGIEEVSKSDGAEA